MKNIDDEFGDIHINLDPEWFSYHILMANTYLPHHDMNSHLDILIDNLNAEAREKVISDNNITIPELSKYTQDLISESFDIVLKSSPIYNKIKYNLSD